MSEPAWRIWYVAGLMVGYGARCQDEAADWQRQSSEKVFVAGELFTRPTAEEAKAERLLILMQGHRAGLHGALGRVGCPMCLCDARTAATVHRCGRPLGHEGEHRAVLPGNSTLKWPSSDAESQKHHNGDYGVRGWTDLTADEQRAAVGLTGADEYRGVPDGRCEHDCGWTDCPQHGARPATITGFRCTGHGVRGCPICCGERY